MRRIGLLLAAVSLAAACTSTPAARSLASPSPAASSPSPAPVASPSPAPVDYGPVPAGVPVFYLGEALAADRLTAFDWTGKAVGTLKVPAGSGRLQISQNAAGDLVYINGRFFDRHGVQVGAPLQVTDKAPPLWADDGRHVCGLRSSGDVNATFRYVLWTAPVGGAPHDVTPVGPETQAGQVGESVVACSFTRDLALVVRTAIAWPTDLWYVRLSTGAVVGHKSYATQSLSTVAASADARYLAENTTGEPSAAPTTVIRAADSGAAVRSLAHDSVWALSADGTAALVSVAGAHAVYIAQVAGGATATVSIPGMPVFAFPEPGGREFLIGVQQEGGSYSYELVTPAGAVPIAL